MKRRLISLLLALALSIGLVLPAYAETAASEPAEVVHLDTCLENCALEDCACECHKAADPAAAADETPVTHIEGCADDCAVEGCACDCHKVTETPEENTVEHVMMCGGEECLIADCTCQCHAEPEVPAEVPTEETPEVPAETPAEGPTEAPAVDYQKLYEDIMATTHLFDADALVDALTEEQMAAFAAALTQEQLDTIDAHFAALIAAYEAEVPAETEPVIEGEVGVESEIHYVTKDVTNAAPFLPPVEGTAPALARFMSFSRAARAAATEADNGLDLNKDVTENEDGTYTLTLEAFATGAKTTTTVTQAIPTDIVLVLDQSGSMTDSFSSTAYRTTSGTPSELYDARNSLFVKLSDGTYASVNVTRTQVATATSYQNYSGQSNSTYYSNQSSLYHLCSDGTYGKVTVTRSGIINRTYSYTCANGCSINVNSDFYRLVNTTEYQYTFSYQNAENVTVSESVLNSASAPAWDFYESYASGNTTRLAALKSAVTTFANNVAAQAKGSDGTLGTDDDINHTISVVGFGRANYGSTRYLNSEVFIGANQYKYGTAASGQYANAPQDMNTQAGVNNISASINALDAEGGTYIDLGIEMANGILNANPVPSGEKRNRVVVIFTDGAPGYNGSYNGNSYGNSGDAQAVADAAMTQIATTKNTHGATVYTVGIFTGADATSAGSSANNASATQRANYFMQRLSSNTAYPQTPSYYLSASDSASLTSIFKSISENIESGGSSITLDEKAVLKDVITDQFELPEGASTSDVKVYTAEYTAADTFATPVEFDADVAISADGRTITVTNFDYAENWVGTETAADGTVTYRGKKLIIEIPIEVRDGFLGGNGVYTNGAGSGVYEDSTAETPIEEFESPTVDVEIKDITVTAPKYNVYLLGGVDADTLLDGLTVESGDTVIDLDPTAVNFGLASWQNAYVEINSGSLSDLTSLTDDATYTATVGIEPNSEGTVSAKTGSGTGAINVFKPEITFNDTAINAGELAVYADNGGSVVWRHGADIADEDTMGTAPGLTYDYDHEAAAFTEDTKVSVEVAIGETSVTEYVTFVHSDCSFENITCTWTEEDEGIPGAEFIVHIKSFDLTITKTGADTAKDPDQTFIFYITGPNNYSQTVIIKGNGSVTIAGLPVGDYTITEDTSWSWRYECANATQTVKPSDVSGGKATVTFNNVRNDDQWLDGNTMAENIFNVLK